MNEDDVEALNRLTEPQRECLRLVMAGFKSKEIAHRLGISTDAVNKRLAAAMATLGAPSRFVAARRLAAYEASADYHSLVSEKLAVEPADKPVDPEGEPATKAASDEPQQRQTVEDPQAPYAASDTPPKIQDLLDPRRLVATPGRAFLVMLAVGVALALLTRT